MANPTTDLFGTPLLPGLEYRDALLSREEEAALIARIDEQDLAPFQL